MDIRKMANLNNRTFCFFLAAFIALLSGRESSADTREAAKVLIGTYNYGGSTPKAPAGSAIEDLEKALGGCEDAYLGFRIKYRIAVMYFKASKLEVSRAKFSQLAEDPNCPELIRISSVNMVGQTSRLTGKNKEALTAFGHIVAFVQQKLNADNGCFPCPSLLELWSSALFSRAEIYELDREYAKSIAEYNHLLTNLPHREGGDLSCQHCPLAIDRMCQIHLKLGDPDEYAELAQVLVTDYPKYFRTPVVKLEIECVRILANLPGNHKLVSSIGAPAQVIRLIRDFPDLSFIRRLDTKLGNLCKEYQNSYGGILLPYHHAWLLDAMGEKDRAIERLAQVFSSEVADADKHATRRRVIGTVQRYARIQSAIMLGEKSEYEGALETLANLQTQKGWSHLSALSKSVTESVQILKREMPKNELE
jgi:tetratricopeptide (TPR) repeat protein